MTFYYKKKKFNSINAKHFVEEHHEEKESGQGKNIWAHLHEWKPRSSSSLHTSLHKVSVFERN